MPGSFVPEPRANAAGKILGFQSVDFSHLLSSVPDALTGISWFFPGVNHCHSIIPYGPDNYPANCCKHPFSIQGIYVSGNTYIGKSANAARDREAEPAAEPLRTTQTHISVGQDIIHGEIEGHRDKRCKGLADDKVEIQPLEKNGLYDKVHTNA